MLGIVWTNSTPTKAASVCAAVKWSFIYMQKNWTGPLDFKNHKPEWFQGDKYIKTGDTKPGNLGQELIVFRANLGGVTLFCLHKYHYMD